jgi:hypothetical protein
MVPLTVHCPLALELLCAAELPIWEPELGERLWLAPLELEGELSRLGVCAELPDPEDCEDCDDWA